MTDQTSGTEQQAATGEHAELTPEQIAEIEAQPCEMFHQEPYDFAWCEVHDTTFALGDVCRYQKLNQARQEATDD